MSTKRAVLDRVFTNFKQRAKEIVGEERAALFPDDLDLEDLVLMFPFWFTQPDLFETQLDSLWRMKQVDLPPEETIALKAAALTFVQRFAVLLDTL